MTIEKIKEAQHMLGCLIHYKGVLGRLEELRDEPDRCKILAYFSQQPLFSKESEMITVTILEKEIEECKKIIGKYEKMFSEL